MRDQALPQPHLPKHLHDSLHGGLVRDLEGGRVHEPPEVDGGGAGVLGGDPAGVVDEEDSALWSELLVAHLMYTICVRQIEMHNHSQTCFLHVKFLHTA